MAFEMDRIIVSNDAQTQEVFDAGLRSHMLRVYNIMASGLALTGIVAVIVAQMSMQLDPSGRLVGLTEFGQTLFQSPMIWVVMLAPLGFIMFLSFKVATMSASTAQAIFWAFAGVMGISLSTIFIQFTGASIARVFFITAGTFAGMSLYGYTTQKDLSNWGSFLMMGLIGIIIASVVNIFVGSSALQFAISVIGVLIFVGLTAYDTQKIKNEYAENYDHETKSKLAIMGALRLYLDFINLLIMLLHLFGNRR
jgi:uncharacterized protein